MPPPSRLAEPAAWQFIPRPHGRLDVVDASGNLHLDIDLLRAFPISAPLGPVAVVARTAASWPGLRIQGPRGVADQRVGTERKGPLLRPRLSRLT